MAQWNISDAKAQISKLIDQALLGGDVVITRFGEPTARLVPYSPPRPPRRFGGWEGRMGVAEDFNAPLPVVL